MKRILDCYRDFGIYYTFISIMTTFFRKISSNGVIFHKLHHYKYELVVKYLYTQNKELINKYKQKNSLDLNKKSKLIQDTKYIWICWWQGYDDAPELVKACINKIRKNNDQKKVVVIDKYNYKDYIEISPVIIKKVRNKVFSITFFSDILRMNLLAKYGGIWIDATVFLNGDILSNIDKYEVFTVKHGLYSSWHVSQGKWTGFFLGVGQDNLGIELIKDIITTYAICENSLMGYLLVDAIITVAYESIDSFRRQIDKIPINNEKVFDMENELNTTGRNFKVPSSINKLSYKHKYLKKINGSDTVYNLLVKNRL